MTNEEALNILRCERTEIKDKRGADFSGVEALDMAIKALGRQDKIEDSNLSTEHYEADLQGAYDCGYNCGYADAMCDIAEREE